jgi:hypothetical protein
MPIAAAEELSSCGFVGGRSECGIPESERIFSAAGQEAIRM